MEDKELNSEERLKARKERQQKEREIRIEERKKIEERERIRAIKREEAAKAREAKRIADKKEAARKKEEELEKKRREEQKSLKDHARRVISKRLSVKTISPSKKYMIDNNLTEAEEFRDVALECLAELLELADELKYQYNIFRYKEDRASSYNIKILMQNIKDSSTFTFTAISTYLELANKLKIIAKPSSNLRRKLN